MDYLVRANKTKVTGKLLGEVMKMYASMPSEDRRSMEARTIRLIQFLDAKGLSKKRADLLIAIDFRLMALARFEKDEKLPGFTMPADEAGAEFIHIDALKAVAEEPLIEVDSQVAFDRDSFRRRVLEKATARGRS